MEDKNTQALPEKPDGRIDGIVLYLLKKYAAKNEFLQKPGTSPKEAGHTTEGGFINQQPNP